MMQLMRYNATDRYGFLNLAERTMYNIDWYENYYMKAVQDTIQEPAIWIHNVDLKTTQS